MDRSGRIVLPRVIRELAGLEAGACFEIVYRGGVVELVPAAAEVEIVRKGHIAVAVPLEAVGPIDSADVDRVLDDLRGPGGR